MGIPSCEDCIHVAILFSYVPSIVSFQPRSLSYHTFWEMGKCLIVCCTYLKISVLRVKHWQFRSIGHMLLEPTVLNRRLIDNGWCGKIGTDDILFARMNHTAAQLAMTPDQVLRNSKPFPLASSSSSSSAVSAPFLWPCLSSLLFFPVHVKEIGQVLDLWNGSNQSLTVVPTMQRSPRST